MSDAGPHSPVEQRSFLSVRAPGAELRSPEAGEVGRASRTLLGVGAIDLGITMASEQI